MKKTLALLIALAISNTASAKVNYDDAISSNDQYYSQTESVHTIPSNRGLEGFELQDKSTGDAWIPHWSGKTTGSISIPSHAKEVFLISSAGMKTFPKNVGARTLATSSVSNPHGSKRVTVHLTYNGHAISGGSKSVGWTDNCSSGSQNNNSQCSFSRTAEISITKVMYR